MEIILRVLQVFLAIGLIGVVLLQRSEGGGLGIGSSGGAGSFMSVRGTANFLTRMTAILAALFMITCLVLAMLAKPSTAPKSIFDTQSPTSAIPPLVPPAPAQTPPAQTSPASEAPALPVPIPGEKPNGGVSLSPTITPVPAVVPPVPAVVQPIAPAPVAPDVQSAPSADKTPAPSADKPKAKKAPQTGPAHAPGQ
jgi:preprotein translocase subunit SecG